MTQRTVAHICLWLMILVGILFLINIFLVPYFASMLADMSVPLPVIVRFIFNLSNFTTHHGWFFFPLYTILFIATIVCFCKTKKI